MTTTAPTLGTAGHGAPTAGTAGTATSAATATTSAAPTPTRRVVDAPVRMFHALFALAFAGAYLTGDSEAWRALHVTLGYSMAGLLAFRVLYGLAGPRPARLALLWRKLGAGRAWLGAVRTALVQRRRAGVPWRQAQNLGMATAIATLLALALPLTLSGYAAYQEWGGDIVGEALAEVHEALGSAMLAVVVVHVTAVVVLSLLRRRNQAAVMFTGRVEGPGPDLVPRNRAGLAVLLLAAVLGFAAWQWRAYPQGLWPKAAAGEVQGGEDRAADDD